MNQAERHLRLGFNDSDLAKIITQSHNLDDIVTREDKCYFIFNDESVITAKFKPQTYNGLYEVKIQFNDGQWFGIGENSLKKDIEPVCTISNVRYHIHARDVKTFPNSLACQIALQALEHCTNINPGIRIRVQVINWLTNKIQMQMTGGV